MHPSRRQTRRLVPLTAATALGVAAVVVPPAAAAPEAETTHTIAEVQGTGDTTPLEGTTVTVEGVVTADHQDGGYRGVYVQSVGSGGTEDSTPGASDAVFVFLGDTTPELEIGDLVTVTGVAAEFRGLTQVDASGDGAAVRVHGNGNGHGRMPEPTPLPDTLLGAEREALEGMLVDPQGDYVISSLHEADRFGSVWLAAGEELPVKSTELVPAGDEADAIAAENRARTIILDDARSGQVTATTQPYVDIEDAARLGDLLTFGDLGLVLGYGFDRWRLQPTTPLSAGDEAAAEVTVVERNRRPAAPDDVLGDAQGVRVAAFNVLNYFTTFNEDDEDARGARNQAQFDIQKSKIVAAITGLDADVVALQEIENSVHFGDGTPDVALADLVAGLNAADGGTWAYVATPEVLVGEDAPDTDVIMNAIIYRTAAVTPVGASTAAVDETVWDIAREPIAQTFTTPAGAGTEFVVIANHFKSKGGDGPEPEDGQGRFNAERVEQAEAVIAFAADLQESTGVDDLVVLGDLNSYSQEDPVLEFIEAGYVDLVATHAPGEYTYTFDGEQGSLDQALATPAFAARVTDADVWDINADEWFGYQYYGGYAQEEATTVYRSSDHDPIVLGLTTQGDGGGDGTVEIDILGINDFHGRLEANRASAGAAVLAGAVDSYRDANPNTLFVSAGDNIGASTFTSFIQEDEPTIEALNLMGLDVSALGNHEFDQGRDDLDDRVLGLADFPYLAANIDDRESGEPAFDPYWVTEVDGVQVGFIGANTEDLPTLVSPSGIATLEIRPVVESVNRYAEQLSDGDAGNGEADVLVLLVHEGPAGSDPADALDDSTFGEIVTGISAEIDAVFSGHTHQAFAHQLTVDGRTGTLPVVQSGQYGENLAHVTLVVDEETGEVVSSTAELVDLVDGDNNALFPADPEVEALVAEAVEVADVLGSVSLGEITEDITRATTADGAENRGGESTLGNLVADVQLWATQDAGTQIAFMNPGGLRDDLRYESTGEQDPAGNVTYREASEVQPFANTLVTMTLTGEQVVDVLEEQWQPEGASRPFLKLGVAGLTYTYDPTAPQGERIRQVWVDGAPIDPAGEYTVVANSFLASGGDNFTTLAEGSDVSDSGRVDLQAFVDYMDEFAPVSPDPQQRAVGVHVVDPPAGGYAPGDEVTVELSSLLFSGGEPRADEVVLSVDGTEVGTFPIDPTVVDGTDEVGRATAVITVPAGATGETLEVVVTVPDTGTTVAFDVPLAAAAAPSCVVSYSAVPLPWFFLGVVTVTNTSDTAMAAWELSWQFEDGERVLTGIGARVTQRGDAVTAGPRSPGATIDPGETVLLGFLGLHQGGPGAPSEFLLDGAPCAMG